MLNAPLQLPRHRFTVDDYERMVDTGILTENDRCELIRGEILDKMTIGDPHIACVNRLTMLFATTLGGRCIVSIQNPIELAESVPEPDVVLFKPRDDFYSTRKGRPTDAFLVIEVADSSLEFDRDTKGPLYAEAGVEDFWIVNLEAAQIEVHRQPRPDGSFGQTNVYRAGDRIDLAALPGVNVAVDDVLG